MTLTVISTGLNAPTKDLCLASARMQLGGPYRHLYVESDPSERPIQHWHRLIHTMPPEEIVVLLDGDDWLFSAASLIDVQRNYLHNPDLLLTYGQFVDTKGRVGFAARYTTADYRSAPWLATHLKTFRAGLFQKIKEGDLMHEGQWIPMAPDCAVMIPMLEMAGPQRILFHPQPLCVYNVDNSHWATAGEDGRRQEEEWAQVVRRKARYGRLP